MRNCLLLILVLALPTLADPPPGSVVVRWEVSDTLTGRTNKGLPILKDALYSDSLPGLPFFLYQLPDGIPLLEMGFAIHDAGYVPLEDTAALVLKEAGFLYDSPPVSLLQFTHRMHRHYRAVIYPFRRNPASGQYEKMVWFVPDYRFLFAANPEKSNSAAQPDNSVLASGEWYRVCTDRNGVFQLTYQDLQTLGINMQSLQKPQLGLFGSPGGMLPEVASATAPSDLNEMAIFISGSAQGAFTSSDYILFYGESPDEWLRDSDGFFSHRPHHYATEKCYFLSVGQGTGKRIGTMPMDTRPVTHQITEFQDFQLHRPELVSLIGSGKDWYGEVFEATLNREFSFVFPDIRSQSEARIRVSVAARSPVSSQFRVRAGNTDQQLSVPAVNLLDDTGPFARESLGNYRFFPAADNTLRVQLNYNKPVVTSRGWLKFIEVNAIRNLRFQAAQMGFRNVLHTAPGRVGEFEMSGASSQVIIWDVTDRLNVARQTVIQTGNIQRFRWDMSESREYHAFDGSSFFRPRLSGRVPNQNLHGLAYHDLIIVSDEAFLDEVQRLAQFRESFDGLSVAIVTPQQVYNEFSSGIPDASAIRNFMKMFYDRALHPNDIPRYLLLFGSGTVDNKDRLGFGGNLIPTFQSAASLSPSESFMTDDFFGLLSNGEGMDAAGTLDIGIGRLPVRTSEEAAEVIDKIIRYSSRQLSSGPSASNPGMAGRIGNYADWRNRVVFIADDGDFNTHFSHAEILTNQLSLAHPQYVVDKIYLDAYRLQTLAGGSRYPDVNAAINNRINQGALLVNYIGHGGVRGLAHERVVTFDDIATWNNRYNLPVMMTATCEFSSFDQPDPGDVSAGVRILLRPEGGAVALYTTTRLAWAGTNFVLNDHFMRHAFQRMDNGEMPRLGDIIRMAKVSSSGMLHPWRISNFVLLGDPSMQMGYPELNVITESAPDTIRAFEKVSISGFIADQNGQIAESYQGMVFPTVFDKKTAYQTLANASGSFKAPFYLRDAMLFRGQAPVVDGRFHFEFVVPRDISYHFGEGFISYYADNGIQDAHGAFDGFVVGGSLLNAPPDQEGPEISIYMNDTTFRSGSMTHERPVLLAFLSDESGINITGRIGHDIVAILNNRHDQPIVLNSWYQSEPGSHTSGRVVYPFSRLEQGHHTLTLRAWDVMNNPSSASIEFVVVRSSGISISDLMNYPNPLRRDTRFVFWHNQAFNELLIEVDIYDMQGRLIRSLSERVVPRGFSSGEVYWDGTTDFGQAAGNGLYVYRLRVSNGSGQVVSSSSKLLIVRP